MTGNLASLGLLSAVLLLACSGPAERVVIE
jgi:hypothetical protein